MCMGPCDYPTIFASAKQIVRRSVHWSDSPHQYSGTSIIRTLLGPHQTVLIIEVSLLRRFPVYFRQAWQCVLVPLSTSKVCSTALPCCTMARKDNQRLELCLPVLVCNVQLVNQSAVPDNLVRDLPASAVGSEFCTVQVLAGPQDQSALRNREVSLIRRSSKYTFLWPTVQDPSQPSV